jgi:hypothetical protein
MNSGQTVIGPIEPGQRDVLAKNLRTPGELLRIGQLRPDPDNIPRHVSLQLSLFAER